MQYLQSRNGTIDLRFQEFKKVQTLYKGIKNE